MKIFKLYRIDFQVGIWKKIRYLLLIGIVFLRCREFSAYADNYLFYAGNETFSLADCLAVIFQGTYPMIRLEKNEGFIMSAGWMILMLMFLDLPLEYPKRSMDIWGTQYTVRISKKQWWIEKCLFVCSSICIGFILSLVVVGIYNFAAGNSFAMTNSARFYQMLFAEVNINFTASLSGVQNIVLLLICPLMGLIELAMLQLFISVWLHPLIAYFISVLWLLITCYADFVWIPGNYMMAMRSSYIDAAGIRPGLMITVSILVILGIMVLGTYIIQYRDIISMKRIDT